MASPFNYPLFVHVKQKDTYNGWVLYHVRPQADCDTEEQTRDNNLSLCILKLNRQLLYYPFEDKLR